MVSSGTAAHRLRRPHQMPAGGQRMFGTLRRYRDAPHPAWFIAILAAFSVSVFLFGLVLMTPVHAEDFPRPVSSYAAAGSR